MKPKTQPKSKSPKTAKDAPILSRITLPDGGSLADALKHDDAAILEKEFYKQYIAFSLQRLMQENNINISQLAKKMNTSRPTIYKLLDETQGGYTLATLLDAANALGTRLKLEFVKN